MEGGANRFHRLQAVTDAALSYDSTEGPGDMLESTRALLSADTCSILLLDEERHELFAYAAVGIEEELQPRFRIPVASASRSRRRTPTPTAATCSTRRTTAAPVSS